MKLSFRLNSAYECLIPDQNVWDICCDHGYLAAAAYRSQKFKNIYFVDQVDSIMTPLQKRFDQFVFDPNNHSKAVFIKNKAQNIDQTIEGTVCVLGVGGALIENILKVWTEKNILKACRLVLSPHKDVQHFLEFMKTQPYFISKTIEVPERERIRQIFIFDLNND